MRTIGSELDRFKGIAPGFDFLRVALAIAVVAWHSSSVTGAGRALDDIPLLGLPQYAILGMFFGLSGFLITGSAQRLSLGNFLINRSLRIFPALMVETFLSAIILGLLFSTLSTRDYFSDPETWGYFTSLFGYIKYQLPGVFKSNPIDVVNLSLWTVPYEIGCYALISGLIITQAIKRPALVIYGYLAFVSIGLILWFGGSTRTDGVNIEHALNAVFVGRASRLFACFMLGIVAFQLRYKIPYSLKLFCLCLVLSFGLAFVRPGGAFSFPLMNILIGPAVIYMCVFLGATNIPTLPLFHRGDYSYGIYLYGAPIQQALVATFPALDSRLANFALSLPLIAIFAAFSWHLIEKPILHLRRKFSFVARVRESSGDL